jgi:hypothetical protein
VVDNGKQK